MEGLAYDSEDSNKIISVKSGRRYSYTDYKKKELLLLEI